MWMKAEWENWTGMKKKLKWSPRWAERSCEEKETESTVVVQWWDSSTYFAKTRNRSSCNLLSHTSENRALIYRLRTISTAVTGIKCGIPTISTSKCAACAFWHNSLSPSRIQLCERHFVCFENEMDDVESERKRSCAFLSRNENPSRDETS